MILVNPLRARQASSRAQPFTVTRAMQRVSTQVAVCLVAAAECHVSCAASQHPDIRVRSAAVMLEVASSLE